MMDNVVELPKTLDAQWRRHERKYRDRLGSIGVPSATVESIVEDMKRYHGEVFAGLPPVEINAPEGLTMSQEQCDWLCHTVLAEVGRQMAELESRLAVAMGLYFDQVLLRHGYRAV
ncbi:MULTISPECIES: hypothetical protein [Pseudomonas]|uniref:hypothetical protein n=1 Tax=Pseudomonas TaxID=286 RepID=UPI0006D45CEF|nr:MULTISPECIES: hypothetical protein [Pseudomonas]